MNKDNWYRGDHWDPDTQDQFERKLKKSKNSYNKAEYLRIKGSSLLSSYDDIKQEVGCKLLNRVIEEYPNETSSVLFALEQLGDYYTSKSNYLEAESNYRQCILYYKK